MSETTFFDDLHDQQVTNEHKPFFAVDHNNEEELLKWLKAEHHRLLQDNEQWHSEIKNNYKRYKEIQYQDQLYQRRDLPDKKTKYTPQVVAPIIRDITDEKVSRLMEYKAAVAVLPLHDEAQDKTDAKVAKRFLRHLDKVERSDYRYQKFLRVAFCAGEAYLIERWDPEKGPFQPDALKAGKILPIGDVSSMVASPLRVTLEEVQDDREPDYCFLVEYEFAEKLRRQYPHKANDINPATQAKYYDVISMEEKPLIGKLAKVTFWHRKTADLPGGFECTYIENGILKKGDNPYQHGMLPLIRLTDNENPEESKGRSFINSIKGMAAFCSNLLNMGIKQMSLMAWAKWFIEAGSVDEQQLNNDVSIVKVKQGSKAPVLGQGNPVSPAIMEWMNKAMEWVYSWGKSNSIVRGEPPAGVTAFVAMQFLSESEARRMNTLVVKFNECVRLKNEMDLSICGQFYKKEDKRTMLILGKDNSWTSANYDPASLAKPYSLVIQNSSALPDSKGARTQFVMDMGEKFPDIFPREQVIEMLDLAQSEKFMDDGASAARCAETENEMMMDGVKPPAPIESEVLITHWRIHVMAMQDISFKTKATPQIQQLFKEHVLATEMLMFDQAKKSMVFTEALKQLTQFPIFYGQSFDSLLVPPVPPPPPAGGSAGAPPPPPPEISEGLPPPQDAPVPLEDLGPINENQVPPEQIQEVY